MIGKAIKFVKESIGELQKVTWLSKEEAINSSIVVVVFIVVFSLFLSFLDYIINILVMWLVK